jgi:octaprenyl-diphosphate synthase
MQAVVTLSGLYKPIQREIDTVRRLVAHLWSDMMGLVYRDAAPPSPIGGKMMRPALSLLSAGASGAGDLDRFVPLATAMELFHLAALAHDDVIDGADMRHGARSLNMMWDNHTAVLGGDYLVARAIDILGQYDSCEVILNALNSVREMSEGELTHFGLGENSATDQACISLARQKTASLFAVACSTPACLIPGAPKASLHAYGIALGIAFQLIDDVLDLTQERETLGKPAFGDIVEGKNTLPILYLREGLNGKENARLERLRGAPLTDEDRAWIMEAVETTGARERTEALAREYIEESRASLADLPVTVYRDAMVGLGEFVVSRAS